MKVGQKKKTRTKRLTKGEGYHWGGGGGVQTTFASAGQLCRQVIWGKSR